VTIQEPIEESKGLTIAEARAAVLESGQLESIDGPHYLSAASVDWRPYFLPSDGAQHPDFGRVIIKRQGQGPREVVISWSEYAEIIGDDDERNEREQEWNAKRVLKPMSIFGAEAERHAYRVMFADILEPLVQARRAPEYVMPPAPQATERDWLADLAAAKTKQDVDALFDEAREAKALKSAELHEAFTRRLRDVLAKRTSPPVMPDEIVLPEPASRAVPSPAAVAAVSKPLTVQPVPKPRGNRPPRKRSR
jgi:hypothetical protein